MIRECLTLSVNISISKGVSVCSPFVEYHFRVSVVLLGVGIRGVFLAKVHRNGLESDLAQHVLGRRVRAMRRCWNATCSPTRVQVGYLGGSRGARNRACSRGRMRLLSCLLPSCKLHLNLQLLCFLRWQGLDCRIVAASGFAALGWTVAGACTWHVVHVLLHRAAVHG